MDNSSSHVVLQLVRSQLPTKVFQMLKEPLEQEFNNIKSEDPVDVLLSISTALENSTNDELLDPVRRRLLTLANKSHQSDSLQIEIEAMTVDGVLNKDPENGCPSSPLIAALYAVSMLYPLKTPEARLNSITQAFWKAAQQMFRNDMYDN